MIAHIIVTPADVATLHPVTERVVNDETRRYYTCDIVEPPALIVLQNSLTLADIAGQSVQVLTGFDSGFRDFVSDPQYAGRKRLKVSVLAVLNVHPSVRPETTLQQLIQRGQ